MSGKINEIINSIISQRAKGNPAVAKAVKTKLVLKGINPDDFTTGSSDDPAIIKKLESLATELGVRI